MSEGTGRRAAVAVAACVDVLLLGGLAAIAVAGADVRADVPSELAPRLALLLERIDAYKPPSLTRDVLVAMGAVALGALGIALGVGLGQLVRDLSLRAALAVVGASTGSLGILVAAAARALG